MKAISPFQRIISIMAFCLALFIAVSPCFAEQNNKFDVRDSMVKIITVASEPYDFAPWRLNDHETITGSGCIISGDRILTNAHVVSNHKFIQVQLYGDAKQYNAHILHVSHEVDLALLGVDETSFFSRTRPLDIGPLPETLQEVMVYGYPTGGDSLSITKGTLSRIVYQQYAHSDNYYIAGQVDAAVNPGNSGGPVIVGNKIVGVVMEKLQSEDTENIGYMIPSPIIFHFLKDVEDNQYDGFPEIGFVSQEMKNPSIKLKYGLKKEQSGILVNHVYWNSPAKGMLQESDVILSIDGHQIADDGTVEIRPKESIDFTHYSDLHQIGEKINLRILRDGKIENVTYALTQKRKDTVLVTPKQYDQEPRYFIFGGIVFTPLTENLICEWESCDAPLELLIEKQKRPTENRQEAVVATHVLAAEVNKGYHSISAWVVKEVNGREFKDFDEFYELVDKSTEPFVVFKNDKGHQIVIEREKANNSHQEILKAYSVTADRSSDLR
jgi:S1-C subfamily serine protease